ALEPGDLIQVDTLHERRMGAPRFQFTAVDPVTRVAHAQLYPSPSSPNARAFLEEIRSALPLPMKSIQVNNGGGFRGAFEADCEQYAIPLYTIQPRSPK